MITTAPARAIAAPGSSTFRAGLGTRSGPGPIHDNPDSHIGTLKFLDPVVWGVAQSAAGPLTDKVVRKPMIQWGMMIQAVAICWVVANPIRPGSERACSWA